MRNNINTQFIIDVLKPFRLWIFIQSIGGIVWAIDLSFRPYLLKLIIDALAVGVQNGAVNLLLVPLCLYVCISLTVVVLFRLYDLAWLRIVAPMKAYVASVLTNNIMLHSFSKNKSNFSGSMANIVNDVMNGIPEILKIVVDKFFTQLLAAGIAIATVATIGIVYASVLTVWLLGFIFGSIYFTKRLKKLCYNSHKKRNIVFAQILDIISNVATICMFATRKLEATRLQQLLADSIKIDQDRDMSFMIIAALQGLTFVIYQAICLVLLVIGFKHGIVSAGDFVLLLNVNISLIGMLRNFSNELLNLSNLLSSVSHGITAGLAVSDVTDSEDAVVMHNIAGKIVFDNVTFTYNNNGPPIFVNKSLKINSGEKIGLVGYSGGGKSTFINLIMRLYDINSGKITIDGYDIRDVTLDSLRYHISIIPQDTVLFNRTIFENIRYGTNANFDAVVVAATIARAHDFIMLLPDNYYNVVGDRGIKLSGGQRQRIAIARAILKNAPIVILDEPTSQLDTITEAFLQESFLDLVAGKTTIVVAHRLATLINMDRILVFEAGTIVEDGSHKQLLQHNGLYARLWGTQS